MKGQDFLGMTISENSTYWILIKITLQGYGPDKLKEQFHASTFTSRCFPKLENTTQATERLSVCNKFCIIWSITKLSEMRKLGRGLENPGYSLSKIGYCVEYVPKSIFWGFGWLGWGLRLVKPTPSPPRKIALGGIFYVISQRSVRTLDGILWTRIFKMAAAFKIVATQNLHRLQS